MRLNDIKDNAGARKSRIRIGRGIGSGIGKTGGRGGKGQTARAGVAIGGFEGGQMPLHRRLPKRGFRSRSRDEFNEVSIGNLQAAVDIGRLDAGKPVDIAALKVAGLVRRELSGVRILGDGEITTALKLTVNHATASARAAIEKAGGAITLIERKILAADEAKRAKTAAKKAKSGGTKKKSDDE